MRRIAFLFLASILIPAALAAQSPIPPSPRRPPKGQEGRPPIPEVKGERGPAPSAPSGRRNFEVMDLFRVRRVSDPRLSADGSVVAFTVTDTDLEKNKRTSHIWISPVEQRKGESRQLTFGEGKDSQPRWNPKKNELAFVSTRSGSAQIWKISLEGGEASQVTKHSTDVDGPVWSPDGSLLAFTADTETCGEAPCDPLKKWVKDMGGDKSSAHYVDHLLYRHWDSWRDGIRTHVFTVGADGTGERDVTPGNYDSPPGQVGDENDYVFSPDSKWILYHRNPDPVEATSTNVDIYLVPVDGKEVAKNITSLNKARDLTARFSPDGKKILYRAMSKPGFEADRMSLWLYDVADGGRREVTPRLDYPVGRFEWHPDGRRIVFAAGTLGRTPLYVLDLESGKIEPLLVEGDHAQFDLSADGKTVAWAGSAMDSPAEIFVSPVDVPLERRLTALNTPVLKDVNLSKPEVVEYKGAGGEMIHGWILKPPGFNIKKRYPMLLWVHGGPQGAWMDTFHYRWNPQPFAGAGFVVFMPNIRGSETYGQKFTDEISGDWGGKAYEDLMRGVDFVVSRGFVDEHRIGAMGGSYGGFMVEYLMGKSPDRFAAFLAHAGTYNLPASYGMTEELWFPEWEFGGTPWENPAGYDKYSPHLLAKNFKKPTLVVHGELDYRVAVGNGIELFSVLQRRGIESRLLYFPDEGHWVLKPQNSKLWFETAIDWFKKYMKP